MIQIDDVVVSLDVLREKFLCDLSACKGECCIEGDAGAPVELDEVEKLEEVLPVIWDDLSPEARAVIDRQGVVYTDCEGDLVTSIVNNKDCVFTCYDDKGCCYCAIEKGLPTGWDKNWNYPVHITAALNKAGLHLKNIRGDFEAKGSTRNVNMKNPHRKTLKDKLRESYPGNLLRRIYYRCNEKQIVARTKRNAFLKTDNDTFTGQFLNFKYRENL